MSREQKIRYYRSYTDDFIESRNQEYKLPENYKWIRTDLLSRVLSAVTYCLAVLISSVYCGLFLHVRFRNRGVFKQARKTGVFVYGNHTQPVGDVFNPGLACFPKRIYTMVSPANLGIPVIGKILPYLGALPIPDTFQGMKELTAAIDCRIEQKKNIVIYPEAHVWEYCKDIRPFPETSFRFPVKHNKPVYCMTTTYQKRRFGKKPGITIYLDGPFYCDPAGSPKEQAARLRDTVYDCMKNRSQNSNYEYICYKPADKE